MTTVLITLATAMTMMAMVYVVWVGVHSLAAERLGPRKLGCKGPTRDEEGNAICCTTGEICKSEGHAEEQ